MARLLSPVSKRETASQSGTGSTNWTEFARFAPPLYAASMRSKRTFVVCSCVSKSPRRPEKASRV